MRLNFENLGLLLGLMAFEAWFLHGFFNDSMEAEPAIGLLLAFLALFAKEPIKLRLWGRKALQHDRKLFEEFQAALPAHPTVRMLREDSFEDDYPSDALYPVDKFVHQWAYVDKEFVDRRIERAKKLLHKQAADLGQELARRTVPTQPGFRSVFPERMKFERPIPEHLKEDSRVLQTLSREFANTYDSFARLCRSRLEFE